jgi:hypothetical protein
MGSREAPVEIRKVGKKKSYGTLPQLMAAVKQGKRARTKTQTG